MADKFNHGLEKTQKLGTRREERRRSRD